MNKSHSDECERRIESVRKMLFEACKKHEMQISADERVSESDAAELLGYAPGSMKNMRVAGISPHFYRRSVGGCKVSYRLRDIAEWIESRREDW
jgi:hypothetical protein